MGSKHCGIDYSLTSPAICSYEGGDKECFSSYKILCLTNNKKGMKSIEALGLRNIEVVWNPIIENQQERYEFIANHFINFIKENSVKLTYLEDYAFASTGRVFHIGENAGLLKYKLWKEGVDTILVPPTVLKKFATTKGNANKNKMYESFLQKTGTDFRVEEGKDVGNPHSDIVDAFFLCMMGTKNNLN